ncbi:MAG: hypothetical protein IJ332_01035 [Clostridia bacterium]|nr:hypothetical protein [Clostridia bacterium]
MSLISEKVAYLQGLAEGLKINGETPEGKLLTEIINVLGSISDELEAQEDAQDELYDKVFELEDAVYGDEDYDDDDEYFLEECDEDEEFTVKCPTCNEEFFISYEDLEDEAELNCPYCNQEIELDLSCDGDCSCCGGDCE